MHPEYSVTIAPMLLSHLHPDLRLGLLPVVAAALLNAGASDTSSAVVVSGRLDLALAMKICSPSRAG